MKGKDVNVEVGLEWEESEPQMEVLMVIEGWVKLREKGHSLIWALMEEHRRKRSFPRKASLKAKRSLMTESGMVGASAGLMKKTTSPSTKDDGNNSNVHIEGYLEHGAGDPEGNASEKRGKEYERYAASAVTYERFDREVRFEKEQRAKSRSDERETMKDGFSEKGRRYLRSG
ncbi:uncharacterized protein MONOS_15433 [Monocercomonoides exilis]|uniref:uncharacterized protein n=1 Tax=Monocercomonoides exilis TaxID=2049356 RepID=UPI00355AB425|nr:hypothetical protein MONOS_15433 [Monocercomonoides exilis]|eukprot:MONOS_15433.1-p1 / transcript=MONOS_15433.1 / gene=MONOS_15433 / organism=Monocercomonoides_exilis_PA203 / gene_product=unspecified product / transcript_product=unspecified product / location=Mono_scaffold01231:4647-5319(-) / protein_length=173 / sequence_SO=supercontig / SO=protein_coding / is_pseudo=false